MVVFNPASPRLGVRAGRADWGFSTNGGSNAAMVSLGTGGDGWRCRATGLVWDFTASNALATPHSSSVFSRRLGRGLRGIVVAPQVIRTTASASGRPVAGCTWTFIRVCISCSKSNAATSRVATSTLWSKNFFLGDRASQGGPKTLGPNGGCCCLYFSRWACKVFSGSPMNAEACLASNQFAPGRVSFLQNNSRTFLVSFLNAICFLTPAETSFRLMEGTLSSICCIISSKYCCSSSTPPVPSKSTTSTTSAA
mmetsp:Transcript_31597/g.66836  ORF Transcript_31597/g.66836 Transcript_31597/m.66836 type:complete len:253 (-) Transcript_31597:108-866(-)